MVEAEVDAATDVTGFGLLGHLHGMLAASGLSAAIEVPSISLLPGTMELARQRVVPGGTERNHEFVSAFVSWGDLEPHEQIVLADAQTSGGLLVATRDPERLEEAFAERDVSARHIGALEEGRTGRIRVRGRLAAGG
jgi:selenide,water dikinase